MTTNNTCSFHDEQPEEETLDPRIQEELEKLNGASDEINKLEKELDEARAKFRSTLSQSTQKLNQLHKQNRKSIEKARPYYTSLAIAKKTQADTQRAAIQFRRSSSLYSAAKETITLAEQRLKDDGVEFTEAWQEMLNHSTMKMMDAEKDKMRSELEHHRKSQIYQEHELKVQLLEKKDRRSIGKSRPYFEMKAELEIQLQQQKQNVDDLLRGVTAAKAKYKSGMEQLEKISEEIHQKRYERNLPVREPGVGCDSEDEFSDDINLEKLLTLDSYSDTASTDADSLFSYDSSSVQQSNHDDQSLHSADDYNDSANDSAICSPKSMTLSSRGRSPCAGRSSETKESQETINNSFTTDITSDSDSIDLTLTESQSQLSTNEPNGSS